MAELTEKDARALGRIVIDRSRKLNSLRREASALQAKLQNVWLGNMDAEDKVRFTRAYCASKNVVKALGAVERFD